MAPEATWTIITVLAGTLSTVVTAMLRYLVKRVEKLETALVEANTSTAATNSVNAKLAAMVPELLAERTQKSETTR